MHESVWTVLATRSRWEDNDVVALVDVFSNRRQHECLEPEASIELDPCGYRWLKVRAG